MSVEAFCAQLVEDYLAKRGLSQTLNAFLQEYRVSAINDPPFGDSKQVWESSLIHCGFEAEMHKGCELCSL